MRSCADWCNFNAADYRNFMEEFVHTNADLCKLLQNMHNLCRLLQITEKYCHLTQGFSIFTACQVEHALRGYKLGGDGTLTERFLDRQKACTIATAHRIPCAKMATVTWA